MQLKSISVKFDRKFNLGDFESTEGEVFISAYVDEEDDVDQVSEVLFSQAKQAVYKGIEEELENSEQQKAQVTRKFAGKKVASDSNENQDIPF